MTSKHPAPANQPVDLPEDFEEDPGIGQSEGLFARAGTKDAILEGENRVGGDTENSGLLGQGADREPGRATLRFAR